jgi:hypothetical protein
LVSDGAECILISKKFFMQHMTEEEVKKLRNTVSYYIRMFKIMMFERNLNYMRNPSNHLKTPPPILTYARQERVISLIPLIITAL